MPTTNDSFLRRNGLSLVLLAFVIFTLAGQVLSGHVVHNRERIEHGQLPLDLPGYVTTGHFVSATFENWESEFLQMGMYIFLSVWLRQKGSAESRPMSAAHEHERIEKGPKPWPVRIGGWWKKLWIIAVDRVFVAVRRVVRVAPGRQLAAGARCASDARRRADLTIVVRGRCAVLV